VRTTPFFMVAVPFAIAISGCGRSSSATAADNVDLQRDLKLASTTTMNLPALAVNPANFNSLETAPQSAPRIAKHLVKAHGPKAIASVMPDLHASQIPTASTNTVPQVQTVAPAPAPAYANDPVASVPRSGSAAQGPSDIGSGDYGRSRSGAGSGNGVGPIPGVVIRGGGMDGDHCEPHGGRGRIPGIYLPNPGGVGGGSRFPTYHPGGV